MARNAAFLCDVVNKTSLGLGISMGYHLNLWDVLATAKGPLTSDEVAEKAGCKERYVREWLGLMVVGKIVTMDRAKSTYELPEAMREYFTIEHRESMLIAFEFMAMGGNVMNDLEECFKKDGPRGLPYSKFPSFHKYIELSHNNALSAVGCLDDILRLTPRFADDLTAGKTLIEVGGNTGHLVQKLAEMFPKSTFTGSDISEDAIQCANDRLAKRPIPNLNYKVVDAAKMSSVADASFDYAIVFEVIHDLAYPDAALREVNRILKPGGRFVMCDMYAHACQADNIDLELGPLNQFSSLVYCMPVSLNADGGKGLGAHWGIETQREYVTSAGFTDITICQLNNCNSLLVCNKPT